MNLSFYSAAVGASAQQKRLDVVANNLANVNTYGFKAKTPGFSELLYNNIRAGENYPKTIQGTGAKMDKTDTLFDASGLSLTNGRLDFAITGEGFFAVQNPVTKEILYTRDGSFKRSLSEDGKFYLTTAEKDFVLGPDLLPIEAASEEDELKIGVYNFENKQGFESVKNNMFRSVGKDGDPILIENAEPERNYLENSNVDTALEMTRMIETQRLFQLNLRMVQTSDEVESTINNLRG